MRGHDRNRNGHSNAVEHPSFHMALCCFFSCVALYLHRVGLTTVWAFSPVEPPFVVIAVDRLAGGCPLRGFDGLSGVAPPLINAVLWTVFYGSKRLLSVALSPLLLPQPELQEVSANSFDAFVRFQHIWCFNRYVMNLPAFGYNCCILHCVVSPFVCGQKARNTLMQIPRTYR